MCTFGVLGRVRAPAARSGGATGVSHDSPKAQTCTFERPGASNTTKIPREDPQRGKKRTNFPAGEGKKSAKFWAPHPSGLHPSGLHPSGSLRAPLFLGLGPHPSNPLQTPTPLPSKTNFIPKPISSETTFGRVGHRRVGKGARRVGPRGTGEEGLGPKGGAPKGGGTQGWGPEGWGFKGWGFEGLG